MSKMNKEMFVDAVHEKMGGTKKQTEELVDLVFNTIADTLRGGGEVSISGFGTFSVKARGSTTRSSRSVYWTLF